jgi:hypothetical protein
MRVFTAALMILLAIGTTHALGVTRQMECREWLDGKYSGLYTFVFDSQSNGLSIAHQAEGQNFWFGRGINRWQLIWQKGNNVVFYGTDQEDWTGPIKIISLDFGELRMFDYSIGGATEADVLVSKIERRCRRLD